MMAATMLTPEAAGESGKRPKDKLENGANDHCLCKRDFDVCVTTYEVCNLESSSLSKFSWHYLVIDEAHR